MKLLAAACVALLFAGCGKGDDGSKVGNGDDEGSGDGWMLMSWDGSDALRGKVYLQLNDDRTFELYQNIDSQGFAEYRGVYTNEQFAPGSGFVLRGIYSGGQEWAEHYWCRVEGNRMELKVYPDGVTSIYASVVIPDYVKTNRAVTTSRSDVGIPFL